MKKQYHGKENKPFMNAIRGIFYRRIITKFLTDCDSILDVGCGSGLFFNIAKQYSQFRVEGVDIDDNCVSSADIHNCDYRNLNKKFDAMFISQFIEHVNQFELMEYVDKYCNKKVIIIAPKPNNKFWDCPDHIRPYTLKSLKRLLDSYGFKILYGNDNLFGSCCIIGKRETQ